MSDKKYRIKVFGKAGCAKCKALNGRLDKMLVEEKYSNFERMYCDLGTEEGLVSFAKAECVNPSRIPAMLVEENINGTYLPMINPEPGAKSEVCKDSLLYTYVGIQTDYTEVGKGLITPKMIKSVLDPIAGA